MSENVVKSVGQLLRSARKKKKVSLEDVNFKTKISIDVLEALEQDDFSTFESDIYLKGFIRNYAGYLDIDPEDVLRRLEDQRGGGRRSNETFWDIEETITEEKLKSPRIFRRVVVPLLFLLILILSLLFINERRKVKRLTPGSPQGYLDNETPDSRLS